MMKFNQNYNSVLIRYCWYENVFFFCFCLFCCCFVVLVCFQHLLFQFTIYDFDSFWFMCLSPVKYLSPTLFLNEQLGGRPMVVFLSPPPSCDDRQSFISFARCCCHCLAYGLTYLAFSARACSVPFTIPVSLRSPHKKQWNIFTHEERRKEKSRIVAYKNEIEEKKSGQ